MEFLPFCFAVKSDHPEMGLLVCVSQFNLICNLISWVDSTVQDSMWISNFAENTYQAAWRGHSCWENNSMSGVWILGKEDCQPCYSSNICAYGTTIFHVQIMIIKELRKVTMLVITNLCICHQSSVNMDQKLQYLSVNISLISKVLFSLIINLHILAEHSNV